MVSVRLAKSYIIIDSIVEVEYLECSCIITHKLTLLFTRHLLQPEHKPWSKNKAYQKRVSKIKGRRVDRQQEREKRRRIKEKTTSNQRDIDELMEDHKTLKLMKKRKVNKLKLPKGV